MGSNKWYFTNKQLESTPSRKCGISPEKELDLRQKSAKLIQDIGQKLIVNQLAINTGIVYMHRFYMSHSFSRFHRNSIAPAAIFLASKVEEQPRKLENVIRVANSFINQDHRKIDPNSEVYIKKAQELVTNENFLLQTLGYDVDVEHPHSYVVKCFQMITALETLPQTSYFMATNSLHMTTMCLQYKPAVVACVCIDIVCKWSNYEIQRFTEGKSWFALIDPTVTSELLERLSAEFIAVLDKSPHRLTKCSTTNMIQSIGQNNANHRVPRPNILSILSVTSSTETKVDASTTKEATSSKPQNSTSLQRKTVLSHKEYNDRKERERHTAQKSSGHPVNSNPPRTLDQKRMMRDLTINPPTKISEKHDKNIERSKHPPIKTSMENVNKPDTTNSKLSAATFPNSRWPSKDIKRCIDSSLGVVLNVPPSCSTPVIIKESVSRSVADKNLDVTVKTSTPTSLYHPRLDGNPKPPQSVASNPPQSVASNPPSASLPSYNDVTTVNKLVNQKQNSGASLLSSIDISKKHKSRHHKDKKHKKSSKHKSKDKERRKEHKKSKHHKKDKHKERVKDSTKVKSKLHVSCKDNSTSSSPITLTLIRDKGFVAPETSKIVNNSRINHSPAGLSGLKISIPKSILHPTASQFCSPKHIRQKDNSSPNVKLQISKERLYQRESRKRERSPAADQQRNKYFKMSDGMNL